MRCSKALHANFWFAKDNQASLKFLVAIRGSLEKENRSRSYAVGDPILRDAQLQQRVAPWEVRMLRLSFKERTRFAEPMDIQTAAKPPAYSRSSEGRLAFGLLRFEVVLSSGTAPNAWHRMPLHLSIATTRLSPAIPRNADTRLSGQFAAQMCFKPRPPHAFVLEALQMSIR